MTVPTGMDHEGTGLVQDLDRFPRLDRGLAVFIASTTQHDELRSAERLPQTQVQRDLAVVHVEPEVLIPRAAVVHQVAVVPIERVSAERPEAIRVARSLPGERPAADAASSPRGRRGPVARR